MTKEQEEAIEDLKSLSPSESSIDKVLFLIKEQQEANKKKDKIIDLMTEIFYKRFKAELLLEYGFESEEQLKQYFENKAKE